MSDLFEKLPNLTPAQLRELNARTQVLLGKTTLETADEQMIYSYVVAVLREAGAQAPSFLVFKKSQFYKGYTSGVVVLSSYIRRFFKPSTKTEFVKVVLIILNMMVERIQENYYPLNAATLVNQFDKVHDIVDAAFPGYRQSNLLHLIIKQKEPQVKV